MCEMGRGLTLFSVIILSGCASIFNGSSQQVSIRSDMKRAIAAIVSKVRVGLILKQVTRKELEPHPCCQDERRLSRFVLSIYRCVFLYQHNCETDVTGSCSTVQECVTATTDMPVGAAPRASS